MTTTERGKRARIMQPADQPDYETLTGYPTTNPRSETDMTTPESDPIDTLARDMYAAALTVDGFSEQTAEAMSQRGYPEHYLTAAEGMAADLGQETP